MSNSEIVTTACMLEGIDEAVFTFAEWKKRGRVVKRGEHARISCAIHKPKIRKNKNGEEFQDGFFLKVAHFFTIDQTEPIKE